jgi:hypothetical protein
MADNLMGDVPLELQPEMQNISQQQKLSQMLLQQGLQQPQGQMISGRYVAPSIFQQLAPLLGAYAGSKGMETAEQKQLELAKAVRQGKEQETASIMEDINAGRNKEALAKIQSSRFGAGKELAGALVGNVIPKAQEPKVVGNYLIGSDGKVIFKAPKEYAPHPSQLVPVAGGYAEYNPNTRTLTPIGGAGGGAGAPGGALMPPLPQHLQTEVASINQQKSSINDALKTVEANKDAFGPKFAAPGLIAGEYGTSRMNEKLPSEQVQARAKVFNIASSVIKERAGTAQSKQEQEIIMRFLPSPYDGEKAIRDKLTAFNDYLTSKEQGINPVIGAVPAYKPEAITKPAATQANAPAVGTKQSGYVFLGGDPANPASWRKE